MEPRTIILSVTFRVGSRPVLGSAGGPYQMWVTADRPRGGHYELTIGDVGNPRMAALARHGDRRLYAQADLAEFCEALFGNLAELLERPVFACCDSPQPDLAGTCQACKTELDADQVRALVDCEHPAVADEPAGERSPCPDCGLVWCQAVAAANVQHHEVGGMTLASYDGATPCERPATRARQDGMTVCTAHQAGDEILGVRPTRR
jgi:hypothetical protein